MPSCGPSAAGQHRAAQKKASAPQFSIALEADLKRFLGAGAADSLDLAALEAYARRQALAVAAQFVAGRLNADHGDCCGPSRACHCGAAVRYAGRRRKTFETAVGPLVLERAYYHCAACEHGRFPLDEALGLAGTHLSPAVQRMTATAGAMASFADAGTLLDELAGVRVPTKQVERTAEAIGRAIA